MNQLYNHASEKNRYGINYHEDNEFAQYNFTLFHFQTHFYSMWPSKRIIQKFQYDVLFTHEPNIGIYLSERQTSMIRFCSHQVEK